MTRTRRNTLILIFALIACLAAEATREFVVFYQRSKELQRAYWRIKPGMSKADVQKIVGQPDSVETQSGEEFNYWRASDRRGPLIRPFLRAVGQYVLIVNMDDQGRVLDVFSGSN